MFLPNIIFLAIVALVMATEDGPRFNEWKAQYGVTYDEARTEKVRLGLFMQNKDIVETHNAKARRGEATFFVKQNRFADMYYKEIMSTRTGFSQNEHERARPVSLIPFSIPSDSVIPASMDWREKGAVSRVKDQGECLSSWAFSVSGALESHYFIKTGKQTALSEQNLIDCSRRYGNNGCRDGTITRAFEYVKENLGIATEASYQYKGKDRSFDYCGYRMKNVGAVSIGFTEIVSGNDDMLMAAVALKGPVSVAVDASSDYFALYSKGIFTPDFCSRGYVNHAMLLVGYGSENGHDYWILKNSWGPEWGENGYMRLSRYQGNSCGISTAAAYPVV